MFRMAYYYTSPKYVNLCMEYLDLLQIPQCNTLNTDISSVIFLHKITFVKIQYVIIATSLIELSQIRSIIKYKNKFNMLHN